MNSCNLLQKELDKAMKESDAALDNLVKTLEEDINKNRTPTLVNLPNPQIYREAREAFMKGEKK